jgi:exodeoxyribonuclease VII large subunit
MRDRLDGLGELVVVGEVTGFRGRPGAHWYFELKDDRSRIGAAFFANANQRHRGPLPRDGDRVVVRGRATFYGPQGRAQLVVTSVEAFGDGDLQRQLEERRARLAAEGLFAAERKRALPLLPRRVGIVTSLQGAALHDVLKVMGGRAPGVDVVVAATRVQGAYASEVVGALQLLDARGGCDVVLVVRGGGAREDLAVFNEESVVRAVVGCSVPVVSGVGHETDVTLCDLAADVRAATPSQAAQFAVPDVAALVTRVTGLQRRLRTAAQAGVDRGARQLIVLERRLPAPAALVQKKARPLVLLEERLAQQSPVARLARQARTLDDLQRRLARQVPDVRGGAARLDDLARRLDEAARRRSDDAEARLRRAVDRLDALSPLAVLRRGWALATVDDRLARADDLVRGARLRLRIDGGDADVVVDTVRTPTERS